MRETKLVDATELLKHRQRYVGFGIAEEYLADCVPTEVIYGARAIDPVHAAGGCYCRECKFTNMSRGVCDRLRVHLGPDGFCSVGEPRSS